MQHKIKAQEVEWPLCLLPVEFLCCAEVLKILVVCPDLEVMLHAFYIVLPLFKCTDDSEHLLVMNLVVPFNRVEAL